MRRTKRTLDVRGLLMFEVSVFAFFGLFNGCYAVLLVDLVRNLDISPGSLGIALLLGTAASISAMAGLGWVFDDRNRQIYLILTFCAYGGGIMGLALAGVYPGFVIAQMLLSCAGGLYDVGINAVAVDLEQRSERRYMSYLHATFSAGAMGGAVGAGALLTTGMTYQQVYLMFLFPLAVLVAMLLVFRLPKRSVEPAASFDAKTEEPTGGRWAPYLSVPILLVAAIGALALLSEGQMENWVGIYLRDTLGLEALVGGSAVAVFYGAMAVGRFTTGWIVGRYGNWRTLISAGLLAMFGMTLALATTLPALAVGGFLLVGLALAGVVPVVYSVAGELESDKAASAVSVVSTLGYGGFLLGPPLIGGLAELTSLRVALGIIAIAGFAIFVLSLVLRNKIKHEG